MDILPADTPAPDPLDLRLFAARMDADFAELQEAAALMGVRRDEPFGALFTLLIKSQRSFAESNLAAVGEMSRIAAKARLAAEGEAIRRQKDQREAEQTNGDLRRTVTEVVGAARQEKQQVHKDLVVEILPKVYEALRKPLVIRETRHNRAVLVKGIGSVILLTLLAVLVGFSVSLWADWRGSQRLEDFRRALAGCELDKPILDGRGVRYCLYEPFLPKQHDPVRADGGQTPTR